MSSMCSGGGGDDDGDDDDDGGGCCCYVGNGCDGRGRGHTADRLVRHRRRLGW